MVTNKQKFFSFFIFILFFSLANFCQAQLSDTAIEDVGVPGEMMATMAGFDTISDESNLTTLISSVIEIFLSFLGIIFLILMLYGGYNWMTAAGDESKVETAKSTIQRAIIGLIIIISAYAITYSVFKALD